MALTQVAIARRPATKARSNNAAMRLCAGMSTEQGANNLEGEVMGKPQPELLRGPLATVTSLVHRRIKPKGALSDVVQPPGRELGDQIAPQSNCSGTDPQRPGEIGLGLKVGNGSLFEHNAKLSMPSIEMQPCLAEASLSLLYMSSQAWKRCETLAERLAWSIEHAKVSQAELALHLKISTAAMSEWFTGKVKNPKLHNIHRAAQFCKVHSWWLAIGDGTPYDGIGSEFEGISGQDLLIAKGLSELGDNGLRGTVQELISARKTSQDEKSEKKRKA